MVSCSPAARTPTKLSCKDSKNYAFFDLRWSHHNFYRNIFIKWFYPKSRRDFHDWDSGFYRSALKRENGNNVSRKLSFNYYIFGNFDLCRSIAESMSNLLILYRKYFYGFCTKVFWFKIVWVEMSNYKSKRKKDVWQWWYVSKHPQ